MASFLRHDVHPLHLADAVAEVLEPPASDGHVVPERDEEDPDRRGEVVGGWRVVVLRAVSGSQLVEQSGDERQTGLDVDAALDDPDHRDMVPGSLRP